MSAVDVSRGGALDLGIPHKRNQPERLTRFGPPLLMVKRPLWLSILDLSDTSGDSTW
jgi:hypothetical protein